VSEPVRHNTIKCAINQLRGGSDPLTRSAVKLLERIGELEPYWAEPYAAPFVPVMEAGIQFAAEVCARGEHAL
jgi:hypothetical protein